MSYSYRAYGFGIDSTANIQGLESCAPASGGIPLRFESGPEPDWVRFAKALPAHVRRHVREVTNDGAPSFVFTEYGDAEFYELVYSDGARFVISGGIDRIWGAFEAPLTAEDLATYLLGPVMGFLMRKKHILCLHASAVDLHGRAVLLSGEAGFGKSTTAAALALRGVPVLSEDVVPLELQPGKIMAVPGYPRVCLWPDSVEMLVGDAEGLPRLTGTWEKRFLPLNGVRAKFSNEKKHLGLIYLLSERSTGGNAPRIEQLAPREALLKLVQNTYMNWLLDREQRAREFDQLWQVLNETPVRTIVPHADPGRLPELCELIRADAERTLR